jgi:hypothetical protein
LNCGGAKGDVQHVGRGLFPLDEELELLPGRYTPRLQEAMTRWGSKLPFQQAADEIKATWQTEISEPTVRRTTQENGRASEAVARQATEEIEALMPNTPSPGERMVVSADGAFVGLTSGEWREVKTVAIGEFAAQWNAKKHEIEVKSSALSYFSRTYPAREFERYALSEVHRRGVYEAKEVVAVNDGAAWIQSFIDYHCPKAERVIDFAHAQHYVGCIGKAILGEETEAFKVWFKEKSHQLKHEPPQRLLTELALFGQQAETDEQNSVIEHSLRYLSQRREMIDYSHFRARGYPIGSGTVESSHKHVVHSRLKQAGMRWAEQHVNPMLALRNLISNDCWDEGWQQLTSFRLQQRWASRPHSPPKPISPPITLDSVQVAPEPAPSPAPSSETAAPKKPWRPPPDHPWRRPWWPSRS